MAGQGRPQAPGRRARAWAWALGVSLAAHLTVVLGLLLVRVSTLQLPVTPRAEASRAPTFIKVGVLGHADAPAGHERAAPEAAPSGTPKRHAGAGSAPAAPGEGATAGPERTSAPTAGEPTARPEGPVPPAAPPEASAPGAVPIAGDVSMTAAGGAVAGGDVPGGDVPGGAATGGAVPGGGATGAVTGGGATGGAGASGRADVVGLVHARLAAGAERCYPAAARRFQQRGTVEVRFCVDGQGAVQGAQVQRSSGAELLDGAVGACVLPQASPFPEAARGQCFTVPVRFGLR